MEMNGDPAVGSCGRRFHGMTVLATSFLLAASAANVPALSAQIRVEGEVLDEDSGLPVRGVVVQFPQLGIAVLTDSLGYFELDGVPEGEQTITTYRIGYETLTAVTPIVSGEILALYVAPRPVALPGIEVELASAGAVTALREGRGSDFIGAGAIADMEDRTGKLLEVLHAKAPPRLRIRQDGGIGGISFCIQSSRRRPSIQEIIDLGSGCHPVMIVLDGVPIYSPPTNRELAGMLAPTLPTDVAALILNQRPDEVTSIRVMTPTDAFFRYGDAGRLGAIEITTKRGGGRQNR